MKININIIKDIPKHIAKDSPYVYCVFGNPAEVKTWLEFHNIPHETFEKYTNFYFPEGLNLTDLFYGVEEFEYVDGFSPNLNKHLHLGHLSNFVLAKTFQSMGIGKYALAHLGDTLEGDVPQHEAYEAFINLCDKYGYRIDETFFASKLRINPTMHPWLTPGEGDYEGTQVFNLGDHKVVGIKSDGSTSYFYQDVALAQILKGHKTLYMTGLEQAGHFKDLETLFPRVKHIGLGLVTLDGEKMSSRKGNVIWLADAFKQIEEKVGDDNPNLVWNIVCGYILKSHPSSNKDISIKDLDDPKKSFGMYLSYTLAKLNSAGLLFFKNDTLNSASLQFAFLKAKTLREPNILLNALVNTAKELAGLYEKYKIKDTPENHQYFKPLAEDLLTGMMLLGMKEVYTVKKKETI